jgi:proteasome lid subunit RPN8/RPN11
LLRPAAFLKLTYLCHAASTEVGGFGLSSEADPLVIEDVLLVKQQTSIVTVEFDDAAVADLIDDQAQAGVPPHRCARVWVHTHPGHSASPSGTDERTFARSFGGAGFSVMLILARGGAFYARLQLTGAVNTAVEIPVVVDWAELPGWLNENRETLPELVANWAMDLATLVQQHTYANDEPRQIPVQFESANGDSRHWWESELDAELMDDLATSELDELEEVFDERDYFL